MYITENKIRNLIKESVIELLSENSNTKQLEGVIKRDGKHIEFLSLGTIGLGSYYGILFDKESVRYNVDYFISQVQKGKAEFHGDVTAKLVKGLEKAEQNFSLTTVGKAEIESVPLSQEARNILIVALDIAGIAGDVTPLTMGPAMWANFQAGMMKLESEPPDEFGAFISFISMVPLLGDAIGAVLRLIRAALEGIDNVPEAIEAWRDSGLLDTAVDGRNFDDTGISSIISHEEYEAKAVRINPKKDVYINTLNSMIVDYENKDVIISNQKDTWEKLFGTID